MDMSQATLGAGFELMLLGMGGVFLFLIILVCLMNFSANFFTKYAHLFVEEQPQTKAKTTADAHQDIAIVLAKVASYKK